MQIKNLQWIIHFASTHFELAYSCMCAFQSACLPACMYLHSNVVIRRYLNIKAIQPLLPAYVPDYSVWLHMYKRCIPYHNIQDLIFRWNMTRCICGWDGYLGLILKNLQMRANHFGLSINYRASIWVCSLFSAMMCVAKDQMMYSQLYLTFTLAATSASQVKQSPWAGGSACL